MKTKTKETWLLIVVLLTGIFFILFKYESIPPAIHFDQITPFISSELRDLGEIDLSLRSQIFNIVNFIDPLYKLIPYLRHLGSFDLIDFTLKLPAMIMFLLSIPIWHLILKEFNIKSKWIFWLLLLTSPIFILYSKFVPTTAGFFLYSSISTLFLLKSFNPKINNWKFFAFFILSIIFATISFYTHIISIIYSAVMFSYLLLFYKGNNIARRFKIINSSIKGYLLYLFFTVFSILTILGIGYLNLQKDSSVLQDRSRYSVSTIFSDQNKLTEMLKSVGTRILISVDPRFLVSGTNQTSSLSNRTEFTEFINPNQSIWLTQLTGPFGIASVLIYISLMVLLFKRSKNSPLTSIVFANFSAFIVLSAISIYDNPSPARTLPALMFIPLGILALYESLDDRSYKIFKSLISIVVMASSIYTLKIFYSDEYPTREATKYEIGIKDIANDIKNGNNLLNSRIFVKSDVWSQDRYLQTYLGPNIVNRIIPFSESQTVTNYKLRDEESLYVITDSKVVADEITNKLGVLFKQNGRYYFAKKESSSINGKIITADDLAYNVPFKRTQRTEEYDVYKYTEPVYEQIDDYTLYSDTQKSFVKSSLLPFISISDSSNKLYYEIGLSTKKLLFDDAYSLANENILIDGFDGRSHLLSQNSFKIQTEDNPKTVYIHILNSYSPYYYILYNSTESLNLSAYDSNDAMFIPIKNMVASNTSQQNYIINPNADHRIILNVELSKLNTDAIIEDFKIYPIQNVTEKYITSYAKKTTVRYRKDMAISQTDCSLGYLILNSSYNTHLRPIINGTIIEESPTLVNGIGNGWQIPSNLCTREKNKVNFEYKW